MVLTCEFYFDIKKTYLFKLRTKKYFKLIISLYIYHNYINNETNIF